MNKTKWRIICWNTDEIFDFYAFNPFKFIKRHLKTYRNHQESFQNITIEIVK